MTKLNTLVNNTGISVTLPQVITAQLSSSEVVSTANVQDMLPMSGNILLNFLMFCRHGNLKIIIDRELMEHVSAIKLGSVRNGSATDDD
jgi:hypothetical protein